MTTKVSENKFALKPKCSVGLNSSVLQYSCLGNPMDRGAWQATFHGIAKS